MKKRNSMEQPKRRTTGRSEGIERRTTMKHGTTFHEMRARQSAFVLLMLAVGLLPYAAMAQFSSGSTGVDGVFAPTANVVIDMADHQDGIYHYASVNIPGGVTVTFVPRDAKK